MGRVPDPLGSLLGPGGGPEPCPCHGRTDCKAFPDVDVRDGYPFLPPKPPEPVVQKRRKFGPVETRHHPGPEEDR